MNDRALNGGAIWVSPRRGHPCNEGRSKPVLCLLETSAGGVEAATHGPVIPAPRDAESLIQAKGPLLRVEGGNVPGARRLDVALGVRGGPGQRKIERDSVQRGARVAAVQLTADRWNFRGFRRRTAADATGQAAGVFE